VLGVSVVSLFFAESINKIQPFTNKTPIKNTQKQLLIIPYSSLTALLHFSILRHPIFRILQGNLFPNKSAQNGVI